MKGALGGEAARRDFFAAMPVAYMRCRARAEEISIRYRQTDADIENFLRKTTPGAYSAYRSAVQRAQMAAYLPSFALRHVLLPREKEARALLQYDRRRTCVAGRALCPSSSRRLLFTPPAATPDRAYAGSDDASSCVI